MHYKFYRVVVALLFFAGIVSPDPVFAGSLANANMCGSNWQFGLVDRTFAEDADNPSSFKIRTCSGVSSAGYISMTIQQPYANNPFFIVSPSDTLHREYTYDSDDVSNVRIALIGDPGFSAGQYIVGVDFFIQGNGGPSGSDSLTLHGTLSVKTITPVDLSGSHGRAFGSRTINSPLTLNTLIKNNATTGLEITEISLVGSDPSRFEFTGDTSPSTLYWKQSRIIPVTYLANQAGSHSAAVRVSYTFFGIDGSYDLPLSGQTTIPVADFSGSSGIDFDNTAIGNKITETAMLTNSGAGSILITSISITGTDSTRFTIISGSSPGTLLSGQSRNISVQYQANQVGEHSASILINYSNSGTPGSTTLSLTGKTTAVIAPILSILL